MESYYADHGVYSGATADVLRSEYDSELPDNITAYTQGESYCLESGDYHWSGPGGSGALIGSC